VAVAVWRGCPASALAKHFDKRYPLNMKMNPWKVLGLTIVIAIFALAVAHKTHIRGYIWVLFILLRLAAIAFPIEVFALRYVAQLSWHDVGMGILRMFFAKAVFITTADFTIWHIHVMFILLLALPSVLTVFIVRRLRWKSPRPYLAILLCWLAFPGLFVIYSVLLIQSFGSPG
jgi:hypothetical protein